MAYDIHCDFDIKKHRETYRDYLEVMILRDGKVVYAIPSHALKAQQMCCEQLAITDEELFDMCPQEYHCDYLTWLLNICGAVAVWNEFYHAGELGLNDRQRAQLKRLKLHGLYKGTIYAH